MEAVGTVAGNVGNREDKAVVAVVAFHTTASHGDKRHKRAQ